MIVQEYSDEITKGWRMIADAMRRIGDNLGTDAALVTNLHYVRDQLRRIEDHAENAADWADQLLVELHNEQSVTLSNVR